MLKVQGSRFKAGANALAFFLCLAETHVNVTQIAQITQIMLALRQAENLLQGCNKGAFGNGNKYGYEDAEGVSPTEREYDRAAELHKSRLIFIKSIGEEERHPKESALIRKVEREIVRKTFVDIEG